MANIDLATPKWRAIRAMWRLGVPVELIAGVGGLMPRFVAQVARKQGWASPAGPVAPRGEGGDFRERLMAALSRRVGDLALDEAGDEERLARSLTALVKSADAAGRLADTLDRAGGGVGADGTRNTGGSHGRTRSDDEVRASLRRKLQIFAGRARCAV